jgi:hypothetical protein
MLCYMLPHATADVPPALLRVLCSCCASACVTGAACCMGCNPLHAVTRSCLHMLLSPLCAAQLLHICLCHRRCRLHGLLATRLLGTGGCCPTAGTYWWKTCQTHVSAVTCCVILLSMLCMQHANVVQAGAAQGYYVMILTTPGAALQLGHTGGKPFRPM